MVKLKLIFLCSVSVEAHLLIYPVLAVYLRKIILRRAINGSPAHGKLLASSNNKKHMFLLQFIVSELQNFPFKAASSRTSNNKHDCVCHICLRYCMAACIIVYLLESKFTESFLSGLKRKLFSLDGVRTTLFLPNNGH